MLWLLPLVNTVAVAVAVGLTVYAMVVKYIRVRAQTLMPELAFLEEFRPVLGHILTFVFQCTNSAELQKTLTRFSEYYNDGFYGCLGHQLWLFIPDHQVMQEVLANQEIVEKNFIYQFLSCITNGVFIAPGFKWRKLRKRLNTTFSGKKIESYMSAVNHHTDIYLNKIIKNLSLENKFVDIQPYVARCLFDIMTKTHFGVDSYEQVYDEFKVTEAASRVIEYLLEWRVLKPHMFPDALFQLSKVYEEICRLREKPLKFIDSLVERRQKDVEENNISGELVYTDMVGESLKEMGIAPTPTNVQVNSADLLIAGSDTTSVTAAALLYFLALHKDMQEKVYEEVSRVFGEDMHHQLTRQDLASMTYLDMAINESLRWSAPTGIIKTFNQDLNAVKYTIPKYAHMYLLLAANHFNPDYYERPNEFYPEHFSPDAVKSRPNMAFLPFSHGPRNCPGKVFAYVLIKASTAVVINNYFLETDLPLEEVTYKILLMTQQAQGYPIRFIPRPHLNIVN